VFASLEEVVLADNTRVEIKINTDSHGLYITECAYRGSRADGNLALLSTNGLHRRGHVSYYGRDLEIQIFGARLHPET